ncbi:hypothetical protein MHO82_09315 [Vibrio sp. Of7-15]|uniref:hypothetical protein n=1 Tax=Vibrio sp. Of7-15 TaxID=2724879 RepID=UPI001EF1C1A3|nr:hypothetical protein [Vibrio sp. Of7-15]MCG7497064.1 hypothetical protein [Vibrio sp. Of7-15]
MRKTLLATGLILASCSAVAETAAQDPSVMSNFSYDYYEARIGASPVTFGGGFSKSIHPNAHAIVTVDSELEGDYDLAGGVGFHAPVNNWADITGEMLIRSVKHDKHYKNGEVGMEINIGVRQWLGPQLEVGGKIGHVSIDDNDDTVGTVYGRFHSTELFSIGVEGRFNGIYDDHFMLSTRFKF